MVAEVIDMYKMERVNVEAGFLQIYNHSVVLAAKVGIEASMPRIASKQQHCSNIQSVSSKEYYEINIAIPFIDHFVMHLEEPFTSTTAAAASLLGLIPSILCTNDQMDVMFKDRTLCKVRTLGSGDRKRLTNVAQSSYCGLRKAQTLFKAQEDVSKRCAKFIQRPAQSSDAV